MNFELHYDLISGCTLNLSLGGGGGGGGAMLVFFLDWGCNCPLHPPVYGPEAAANCPKRPRKILKPSEQ